MIQANVRATGGAFTVLVKCCLLSHRLLTWFQAPALHGDGYAGCWRTTFDNKSIKSLTTVKKFNEFVEHLWLLNKFWGNIAHNQGCLPRKSYP